MSMQSLLAASQSMARMQTMRSAQGQMQSTANILRIESKQDGGNEKKEAKAAALDAESNDLMGNLMNELTDVNETLKPDEDAKAEKIAKEKEETAKSSETDTVSLSDSATKRIAEGINTKPAVLEAVTYKADGSTKPSVPAMTSPTLDVTA